MIKLEVTEEEFSQIYRSIRVRTLSLDDELSHLQLDTHGFFVDTNLVKEIEGTRMDLEKLIDKLFNQKQGI